MVEFSDFISDGDRTGFNGFEAIPNDGLHYTGGAGPYDEGGIRVEQVNGDFGNDIWISYFFPEGSLGWYPDGGDFGWTRITNTDGSDFNDVGFLRGSGYGDAGTTLGYELRLNGATVLSGTTANTNNGGLGLYLGFSGGGFDEILLADAPGLSFVGDGSLNALALDAIEVRGGVIPEPSSIALLAIGLVIGCGYRRRSR
jgi:hypothetical protein